MPRLLTVSRTMTSPTLRMAGYGSGHPESLGVPLNFLIFLGLYRLERVTDGFVFSPVDCASVKAVTEFYKNETCN